MLMYTTHASVMQSCQFIQPMLTYTVPFQCIPPMLTYTVPCLDILSHSNIHCPTLLYTTHANTDKTVLAYAAAAASDHARGHWPAPPPLLAGPLSVAVDAGGHCCRGPASRSLRHPSWTPLRSLSVPWSGRRCRMTSPAGSPQSLQGTGWRIKYCRIHRDTPCINWNHL